MMRVRKNDWALAWIALMAVSVFGCGRGAWYEAYGIENERQLRSPESIPHLQRALEDGYCEAAEALGRMRAKASEAVPDLLDQIDRGECLLQAAKAVDAVSPDRPRALAAAVKALERVEVVSSSSLDSLSSIASLGSLKSKKSMLDSAYVDAFLKLFSGHGQAALPDLVKLVGHERWEVRYCAIRILAGIGNAKPNVIEALKRAEIDRNEDIRQVAKEAMRKLRFADLAKPGEKIVIAVFDVADPNGQFAKADLEQLTDYLSAQMAEIADFRVVPRDQVRSQLASQKRESFKAVFDERTQLQLGKALAARKSLATRLLKIDDKCVVTATLFDLKSETTEKAATVDTGCSMDSLTSAMKEVARKLSDKPL